MDEKKPSFALMIEKGLDKKVKPESDPDDMAADLGIDDSEQDQMENSAVSDLLDAISAKDVLTAKAALKDFVKMCYTSEE